MSLVIPQDPRRNPGRRRGRPAAMSPSDLIERIRELAARGGLFRVHHTHARLYARARRRFGSWAGAVRAAGLDYRQVVARARARALQSRRGARPKSPFDSSFHE